MQHNNTAHVIGGGLAGLAAAITAHRAGYRVTVYEATSHLGGRCRSWAEPALDGAVMDNGTHLVLGCNRAVFRYLALLDASERLREIGQTYPMRNVQTGQVWAVTARIPFPPGIPWREKMALLLALLRVQAHQTVADLTDHPALVHGVLAPLCEAVLNTRSEEASARLLQRTLWHIIRRGQRGAAAWLPVRSLQHTFVDPAVEWLERQGIPVHYGQRLRQLDHDGASIHALQFNGATIPVGADDRVVLAVPLAAAVNLLPGLRIPVQHEAICNIHFLAPDAPASIPFCGLVGGMGHWAFRKGNITSVTISAAPPRPDPAQEPEWVQQVWLETCAAFSWPALPCPPWRVVMEKQATPRQTPAFNAHRPPSRTAWRNLRLAGDWTDTGLPCTLEGAISSGLSLRLA